PFIAPNPLAGMPVTVAVLSRVHVNVVFVTLLVGVMPLMALPLQMLWLRGVAVLVGQGGVNVRIVPFAGRLVIVLNSELVAIAVTVGKVCKSDALFAIPTTPPGLAEKDP